MMTGLLHISGVVRRDGSEVEGAYVGLFENGEFIAENRTGPDGRFAFHTTAGDWEIRCRAARMGTVSRVVSSGPGEVTIDIKLVAG